MIQSNPKQQYKWIVPSASLFALILVILYALGIIGGGEKIAPGNTPAAFETATEHAETLTVKKQFSENRIALPGTVRSRSVAKIAPKLNARIVEVKVNAGDLVKQGELIALLDERVYQAAYHEVLAALNEARAQAAQATADAARITELYAQEAATRENYDAVIARSRAAQAAVKQAASAVEQARVTLGDNELRAPFAGIITRRLKEPGDMGLPNDPIVILQKQDDLRFEVPVPARYAELIKLSMPVTVRTDTPPRTWQGKITEIVPEIDPRTRSQLVKADLPFSKALKHGQFGWLMLSCGEPTEMLLIPASALLHYGQLEAVKVIEDGKVFTRHVRTGKKHNGSVEILSGLREGETIITAVGLSQ